MPVLLTEPSAPAEQRQSLAELPEPSSGAQAGPQPQPPAEIREPEAASASSVRQRGRWLLRQRQSANMQPQDAPVGLRLQSSEILVPDSAPGVPRSQVWLTRANVAILLMNPPKAAILQAQGGSHNVTFGALRRGIKTIQQGQKPQNNVPLQKA